jgi:hypothetical protein
MRSRPRSKSTGDPEGLQLRRIGDRLILFPDPYKEKAKMSSIDKYDVNSRYSGEPARPRRLDRVRFRPLLEPLGSRVLPSVGVAAVVPAAGDVGTASDATDQDLTSTDDGSASLSGGPAAPASPGGQGDSGDSDSSDPTDSDDLDEIEDSEEVETEVETDG